ncbi:integral membrane protein [Aspergillus sclerotioniger CBS 115572]|uniref:Integral membrane protein n=1 Tax=Aspergillus sclerotioniger CBS 115572 TaxID=1450535 RepID=A0A317WJE2_9EURO|nr:integral membrane protein [Aspergillus sclerotioniger CBS 115572]PWY86574.1 integral membrane protein [Aspergillus sclerotioniger CBS 115572]
MVISVLVGLACLSTVLRIAARVKRHTGFGMDDHLCFVAIVLMVGMLIELILWCTMGGSGYHMSDLDARTIILFHQIFIASQFTYFVLSPTIKISFICFYRRIFTTKRLLRFTFCLIIFITSWAIAIFLSCAFQCRPLRAYWDRDVEGDCFSSTTYIIVNQAFNVAIDFVILAAPVPMVWRLHRPWQDKLALNSIFALGGFVCFASVYRIVVLFYIDLDDETYTIYDAAMWTHVEPSVGLVVSCLPIIRGLFPKFTPKSQKKASSSPPRSSTTVTWTGSAYRESTDDRRLLQDACVREERNWTRLNDGRDLENMRVTDIDV